MFLVFETERTHSAEYIVEQVNLLTEIFAQFEEQKTAQIQEMLEIARYLNFL